jgi:hypothetical protein
MRSAVPAMAIAAALLALALGFCATAAAGQDATAGRQTAADQTPAAAVGQAAGDIQAVTAAAPSAQATAAPARGEVTRYKKGYRYESNGWIFLHIEGKPFARGVQHGRLMAPELAQTRRTLRYVTPDDTGKKWSYFVKAAPRLWRKKISNEYLNEIKGIAAGATRAGVKMTWQEVLAINGQMELTESWWPGVVDGAYRSVVDNTHCSAFIATGSYTRDGEVVMAHNDWDHFATGQSANVIIDVKPARGHRIVMQTFPGCIASMTDFFATSAGLMGTETTIGDFNGYAPKKLPEFYRMRKATQYADTLREWVRIMQKGNNGGYANSWLLADADTSEIMRFEQGLKYQSVERTKDGYFVGFNSATDPQIRNLECGGDRDYYDIRTPAGARRVRLTQLMQQHRGQIDAEVAKAVLADHYDVYLKLPDNPCSRTVDGHYELDPFPFWQARQPYSPQGAVDGKVMDSDMARELSFVARWGNSSGMPFDASAFLAEHPQWDYLDGYLEDRPTQPWTLFKADLR